MNPQRTQDAVRQLSARNEEYEAEIACESSQTAEESDGDVDSDCPILDSFYSDGGNDALKTMYNFTGPEFRLLLMQDIIVESWNKGRGRRSPYNAMRVLFMLLTTMKHGGSWGFSEECLI